MIGRRAPMPLVRRRRGMKKQCPSCQELDADCSHCVCGFDARRCPARIWHPPGQCRFPFVVAPGSPEVLFGERRPRWRTASRRTALCQPCSQGGPWEPTVLLPETQRAPVQPSWRADQPRPHSLPVVAKAEAQVAPSFMTTSARHAIWASMAERQAAHVTQWSSSITEVVRPRLVTGSITG